ncbi:MAG: hypothetical protein N4J56_007362 [Chroococcidiopsis sp. SAG 2025]|uniref:hypothetical protein n=1 Tax=Chroococcidiopsis sp. SAG 2025 TaxID=171389 RepID=UPI002936EE49|nr:hypothetical protein [Chroococcidiopsis sp. SAG 2025]MDV2997657.1 hypothetical protein [Chroococcidiopsis sp. SAG 2025]
MKLGMTLIQKQTVGDRFFLLASDNKEWATYTSISSNASDTEHGHYFTNLEEAIADFWNRVTQALPRINYRNYEIETIYTYFPPKHRHSEDEEVSISYRIRKDSVVLSWVASLDDARDFIDLNITNPEAQF